MKFKLKSLFVLTVACAIMTMPLYEFMIRTIDYWQNEPQSPQPVMQLSGIGLKGSAVSNLLKDFDGTFANPLSDDVNKN